MCTTSMEEEYRRLGLNGGRLYEYVATNEDEDCAISDKSSQSDPSHDSMVIDEDGDEAEEFFVETDGGLSVVRSASPHTAPVKTAWEDSAAEHAPSNTRAGPESPGSTPARQEDDEAESESEDLEEQMHAQMDRMKRIENLKRQIAEQSRLAEECETRLRQAELEKQMRARRGEERLRLAREAEYRERLREAMEEEELRRRRIPAWHPSSYYASHMADPFLRHVVSW